MKEVDVTGNELVLSGKEWEHPKSPCCKDMIKHLVRRECYCSWFQPMGGNVWDQFPAIKIKDKYYTLSLRVQKAMFRHVRLTRDFNNIERLPDGELKLRIPMQLLQEKRRTATRFTVCIIQFCFMQYLVIPCMHPLLQVMRSKNSDTHPDGGMKVHGLKQHFVKDDSLDSFKEDSLNENNSKDNGTFQDSMIHNGMLDDSMIHNGMIHDSMIHDSMIHDCDALEGKGVVKSKKRSYTKRKRDYMENDTLMSKEGTSKRVRIDKKWVESDNVDIDDILNQILLSVPSESKSSHTVFSLSEWETAEHIVHMLFKECPTITKSKMDFAMHMSYLYDKIVYN